MATLEEMNEVREKMSAVKFPPDSLGIIAMCDHTGRIMFTAMAAGEEHVEIDGERAFELYSKLCVALGARVASVFTHTGDPSELEHELATQQAQGSTLQ